MTVCYCSNQIYTLFLIQYLLDTPSVIKVQVMWESKTSNKHVSFSRALRYNEDYDHTLAEIKAICTYAFQDSQELGDSPYYELIFGVNCLDEL